MYIYSCIHKLWSNLSSLCTPSLESRAWCNRDAESCQALRQAVGASTGECECSIPATILLSWRHQPLLAFTVYITLCLPPVFSVAAPLPPEARTLLAAQMVQRRCPFGWALNIQRWLKHCSACVYVRDQGEVCSDYCQILLEHFATFDV